jgi:hypothetical protein
LIRRHAILLQRTANQVLDWVGRVGV